MEAVLYLLGVIAFFLIVYGARLYLKNRRFWRLVGKIKGERTLPLIGNAHQMGTTSEDILRNTFKMYQNANYSTFKFCIGSDIFVLLCEPNHIEAILCDKKEITKLDDYKYMAGWLGDGLLLATGNKWQKQRKIITPAFHFKILERFVEVFNDKLDIFIEKLEETKGVVFDIYPLVTLYALDIINETAMGVSINAQGNAESDYVKAVYRICALYTRRTYSPFKRNNFLYSLSSDSREEKRTLKILHATTNKVIQDRKLQLKDEIEQIFNGTEATNSQEDKMYGNKKRMAFLDILLLSKTSEGEPLSDESIREEVDTFMFGGHHTTSSATSFAIYCLANNPDVQDRAFAEQLAIFGDDLHKTSNYEQLLSMKYLEMVIKESLRLYPTVPLFGRKLVNDLRLDDKIVLPGGCFASVNPFCLNRNPKLYPDPEKFDPERFSPENIKGKHPYSYVPFSAGPRNCIGQKFAMLSIKGTLSKILRKFELYSAGPGSEPRLATEVTLTSVNGIQIQLKDRNTSKKNRL